MICIARMWLEHKEYGIVFFFFFCLRHFPMCALRAQGCGRDISGRVDSLSLVIPFSLSYSSPLSLFILLILSLSLVCPFLSVLFFIPLFPSVFITYSFPLSHSLFLLLYISTSKWVLQITFASFNLLSRVFYFKVFSMYATN